MTRPIAVMVSLIALLIPFSAAASRANPTDVRVSRAAGASHGARDATTTTKPIVVIDPGHGGPDSGATYVVDGQTKLLEKTVTLEIAKRTAALLRKAGYTVYLTRTTDTAVNVPPKDLNGDGVINSVDEGEARVWFARKHHAGIFLCMHINATSNTTTGGLTIYYNKAHKIWGENRRLAFSIDNAIDHRLIHAGYTPYNWGVHTDQSLTGVYQRYADYPYFLQLGPADKKHGLISQNAVAVLGETLYISDTKEEALLTQPKYLEAIAAGYSLGVQRYVVHTP